MFVIGVAVLFVTHMVMLALGFLMGIGTAVVAKQSKEDENNER